MLRVLFLASGAVLLASQSVFAAVEVKTERTSGSLFEFQSIPLPALDDAGSTAKIVVISGQSDGKGKGTQALNDGEFPSYSDHPASNFFFSEGSNQNRILFDLGKATRVKNVVSYSWHSDERAPQVYALYAAKGDEADFNAKPSPDTNLEEAGWALVAKVDTSPGLGQRGGQHAALISDAEGNLGVYRYLLFDVSKSVADNPFGETFFSEIDVIDADAPEPKRIDRPDPVLITFTDKSQTYKFTIDATLAPDLKDWSKEKLQPVVMEWYPRIVELLNSEGFYPPQKVTLRYQNEMGDKPAWAEGPNIALNIGWYRDQLQHEALGAAVHELVHVAQLYPITRRNDPAKPEWIVEGIPDYVRWYLYEPQSQGAELTSHSLPEARYDGSYRVTANFLEWASRTYDKDLIQKLNTSVREGKYSTKFWKATTGLTEEELNKAWIDHHRARLIQN